MRTHKPTTLGTAGVALGTIGIGGMVWGSLDEFHPDRIGIALLMSGITLICFKRLERKNLAADEIFNLGRERGEGDAYDEGFRDGVEEGRRSRPAVVQLHPKCEECGRPVKQFAGSVADRG